MWLRLKAWCLDNKYALAIMLMATALLVFRVNYRTFWMDETMILNYLKFSLGGFFDEYLHNPDNHPPLYYLLVLVVSKIVPWTELTIRLVSIVSGLGIVWLVYRFMQRVTKNETQSLVAAFFTAFSAYFVLISQMARYHSLAAFTSLFAFYFFYRLYSEGYTKYTWLWFVVSLVLVGYSDYPHFVYVAMITNAVYVYGLIRKNPFTTISKWVTGQVIVGILCSPMVWMVYHRIIIQGDGGFDNVNLLANSWKHKIAAILFHIYSYFFGETILPWNIVLFGLGALVLTGALVGLIIALKNKKWGLGEKYIIGMSIGLIVLNTLVMNVADPRYNFIVYPKFGFVAYPFWIMSFVLCLSALKSIRVRTAMFVLWGIVSTGGLVHFYRADNYLNPSYFRTFESFEYVRDRAKDGQYLAITPNASEGVYLFYKQKYFKPLKQLPWENIRTVAAKSQVWFFATSADGTEESVSTDMIVPDGFKVLERFDSVPLNLTLQKIKEKVLHRPSYTFKYSVFLLEKI